METGYPNGVASLVCLRDGTTSLYTSTGGGMIGGGAHDAVVRANHALLATIEAHLGGMASSSDHSLPGEGRVIIRALTYEGQFVVDEAEDDLGHGRNAVSPVFQAGHDVITQLRVLDEQRS